MLGKKIEYLLWLLGTDNTHIAAYAGCSESNFSRLRSGARVPRRSSPTVKRFASAVCSYAFENNLTEELRAGLEIPQDAESFEKAVIDWLFDDQASLPDFGTHSSDSEQFGKKLSAAMDLVGMSSSRLSRAANIDPSYVSRMRGGKRLPKSNPMLINRICMMLVQRAEEQQLTAELCALIGADADADESALVTRMYIWLYDKSVPANITALRELIKVIDGLSDIPLPKLPSFESAAPEDVLNDTRDCYGGIDGMRRAVTRFLGTAARLGDRELELYSDQSLDWMEGEFTLKWLALMKECISRGVHFKIIHNIDRSVTEMISAISCWMPLYMSGMITPYYSQRPAGDRFHCTVFLDRGRAGIRSFGVKGMEQNAEYFYVTDRDKLRRTAAAYDALLKDCRPLLKIQHGVIQPENGSTVYTHERIRCCISTGSVVVIKLSEPQLSFIFDHPLMCRAFRAYVNAMMGRQG